MQITGIDSYTEAGCRQLVKSALERESPTMMSREMSQIG